MSYAPRGFLVEGPKALEAPCDGLFSVVPPEMIDDPHWMASGIEWETFLCGPTASGFTDECPPTTGYTKLADRNLDFCHADPFVVYASFQCSPIGRNTDEAFDIARKRLLAWEQYEVERIFWTGNTVNSVINPSLSLGNDQCSISPVTLSGAAVSPASALHLLESNLSATVPCGGVIHIPKGTETFLATQQLLTERDGKLFSPAGYEIVTGAGYPGTGPSAAAPAAGATWIFATGPMVIVRSEVMVFQRDVKESVNRSVNTIEVRAERFYSVGYSCANFAVEMSLSCAC